MVDQYVIYYLLVAITSIPSIFLNWYLQRNSVNNTVRFAGVYGLQLITIVIIAYSSLIPGGITPDSEFALRKAAYGFSEQWGDLHAHGLTLYFMILGSAYYGMESFIFTVVLMFTSGMILIVSEGLTKLNKIRLICISALFFFPPIFTILGMIWKDILHESLYILAIGLVFLLIFRKIKFKSFYGISTIAAIAFLLAFGQFVRSNAASSALPIVMMLFLPYGLLWTKQYAFIALKSAVLVISVGLLLISVHDSLTTPDLKVYRYAAAQRFDIAYISRYSGVDYIQESPWMKGFDYRTDELDYEHMMKLLDYPWLLAVEKNSLLWKNEIQNIWIKAVANHPYIWLQLKWYGFLTFSGFYSDEFGHASFSEQFYNRKGYSFNHRQTNFSFIIYEEYIAKSQSSILFAPYYYYIIALIAFVSLSVLRGSNNLMLMHLLTSGLLIQCTFAVLLYNYGYRWSHYFITTTSLTFLLIFVRLLENHLRIPAALIKSTAYVSLIVLVVFFAQIFTKIPDISLKLAERLQKSENCIESLKVYQNPLNYSYTDDKRFSFLGKCYESRGQYNMAKAVYRHWTTIDPQSYDAWYSLGFAMEREYQINDAIDAYIKAYTLESQEYDVNLALGRTYLAKQMYKDAKTALIRATEINPQRYEAWLEISFAFLESREDNAAPWSLGLVKERINQLTQEDRHSLDIAEALLICHQEPRSRCVQNARDVDVFHKPIDNRSIALKLILRAMNADRTGAVYVAVPASDDVAAFHIARTEVTNAQYAQCVTAGVCSEPVDPRAYQLAAYANHPVVYVSLEQAREYAAWVGGSLPTETQWLRACQGDDGRTYPWGNEPPTARRANYADDELGKTTPVGAFPTGSSPYGVADMAGNVWEWAEPDGSDAGRYIVRGGQFNDVGANIGCATRSERKSSFVGDNVGFRVVMPEP